MMGFALGLFLLLNFEAGASEVIRPRTTDDACEFWREPCGGSPERARFFGMAAGLVTKCPDTEPRLELPLGPLVDRKMAKACAFASLLREVLEIERMIAAPGPLAINYSPLEGSTAPRASDSRRYLLRPVRVARLLALRAYDLRLLRGLWADALDVSGFDRAEYAREAGWFFGSTPFSAMRLAIQATDCADDACRSKRNQWLASLRAAGAALERRASKLETKALSLLGLNLQGDAIEPRWTEPVSPTGLIEIVSVLALATYLADVRPRFLKETHVTAADLRGLNEFGADGACAVYADYARKLAAEMSEDSAPRCRGGAFDLHDFRTFMKSRGGTALVDLSFYESVLQGQIVDDPLPDRVLLSMRWSLDVEWSLEGLRSFDVQEAAAQPELVRDLIDSAAGILPKKGEP